MPKDKDHKHYVLSYLSPDKKEVVLNICSFGASIHDISEALSVLSLIIEDPANTILDRSRMNHPDLSDHESN
jgi:hypothetical protein